MVQEGKSEGYRACAAIETHMMLLMKRTSAQLENRHAGQIKFNFQTEHYGFVKSLRFVLLPIFLVFSWYRATSKIHWKGSHSEVQCRYFEGLGPVVCLFEEKSCDGRVLRARIFDSCRNGCSCSNQVQ